MLDEALYMYNLGKDESYSFINCDKNHACLSQMFCLKISYTQEACLMMKVHNRVFWLYFVLLCLCTAQTGKSQGKILLMDFLILFCNIDYEHCIEWPTVAEIA